MTNRLLFDDGRDDPSPPSSACPVGLLLSRLPLLCCALEVQSPFPHLFPSPLLSRVNGHGLTSKHRWVNLWWPAEIGEDIASEECVFDAGASELGALVFVGNLILVVGILLGVFLLHIVLVSGVEAYWLTKVRLSPP